MLGMEAYMRQNNMSEHMSYLYSHLLKLNFSSTASR